MQHVAWDGELVAWTVASSSSRWLNGVNIMPYLLGKRRRPLNWVPFDETARKAIGYVPRRDQELSRSELMALGFDEAATYQPKKRKRADEAMYVIDDPYIEFQLAAE